MSDFVFKITGVARRYPGSAAIQFPGSIEIPRGEMIGVLGRSGTGKTTLLNLLAMMDEADEGEIVYFTENGKETVYRSIYGNAEEGARFRKEKLGFVFQNDELLDGFSVRNNIQMPYWPSGVQLREDSLQELLRSVKLDIVEGIADKNPADLSAGQRSRIGVLRALSGSPSPQIIFADEPTANVDTRLETEIYELLDRWRTDPRHPGRTILLSTHRLDIASQYCTSYIFIDRDEQSGQSIGRHEPGRKTEAYLRERVVGEVQLAAAVGQIDETRPHGRLLALWKFLFYDFWRYPRSKNSFLVSRIAPLLLVLAVFLFVWLGSFILGIREGSSMQYASQMQNDLLWNTEIGGSKTQIEDLVERHQDEKLFKSHHGFFRLLLLPFSGRDCDQLDKDKFEQITGRTMENEDPLLGQISQNLLWPTSAEGRSLTVERFKRGDFGIIVNADSLSETLGYQTGSIPSRIAVRLRQNVQVWVPIIGVAREIPGADFLMNTTVYAGYLDREFVQNQLKPDSFLLEPAGKISDDNAVAEQNEKKVEAWLNGLGVETDGVNIRNIDGEALYSVNLLEETTEFPLACKLTKNLAGIKDVVSGVRFPKDFRSADMSLTEHYQRWSIILFQDLEKVHKLIQAAYGNNMVIDTAVQARVSSLQESYRIFRTLSSMLFWTALVLAAVLLFTTVWFDSNRKVHSVGVMLSQGISRPFLIAAYALQFYLLIGLMLGVYAIVDAAGWMQKAANLLGDSLGSKTGLLYSGWSLSWVLYISVVLLVVPAGIAALRFFLYRNQPAELLNFRD